MNIRGARPIATSVSLMAMTALGQGVALAQEQPAAATSEAETIVVTASRRAESLQDTALAVTAVDPEELSRAGLNRLREVVENTPGVHYSGGGLANGNTVTMRGVAQTGRATTVGIYVDDVPIGSSNSFAAGPSLHFDAVQGDVERIELVRGPQGIGMNQPHFASRKETGRFALQEFQRSISTFGADVRGELICATVGMKSQFARNRRSHSAEA